MATFAPRSTNLLLLSCISAVTNFDLPRGTLLVISDVSDFRVQGFPIAYNKQADTYYCSEPVKIEFSNLVGHETLLTIQGGEKKLNFFSPLPDLGSGVADICSAF